MKKLLVVIVILLVAVLMTQTVPDKEAHKEAMMKAIKEYVDEEAEDKGLGDNILTKLGKNIVNKTIEVALNSKLKVNNYYVLNTTSVRLKGKDQILSLGILGQVITFDKDMIREKLEEAAQAKSAEADEKAIAKQNKRELKRLEKEKRKQEKKLLKEKKRAEKQARKEQKRKEKEARKLQKQKEKAAKANQAN